MAQSMTGYGRGEHSSGQHQFAIEIRSTNHRFLEVKLRFPRELIAFESDVRPVVRKQFSRGYLDVQAFLGRPADGGRQFTVDETLLEQVASGLQAAGRSLDLEDTLDLAVLSRFKEIFRFEETPDDPEELREGIMDAVGIAVSQLLESREREGQEIVSAIARAMDNFSGILSRMEEAAPAVNARLVESLRSRLDELLERNGLSAERLHQEAAVLTAKADVTEELERLRGHYGEFAKEIGRSSGPVGRKMDFLLQEMNRELNTTGAKAGTLELSHLAIEGKLELEKVKEQVQNLE
jgi:uncharacterized protein (TIGR00255 family)